MSNLLSWNDVKTRKPHICFGCNQEYPRDTKMARASYTNDGTAYTCYWCSVCEEYMARYFDFGDETGQGGILNNDREGWEEIKKELEGKNEQDN